MLRAQRIDACHEVIVGIIGNWNFYLKDSAVGTRAQRNASHALREFDGQH
jgi:hypothetical protein